MDTLNNDLLRELMRFESDVCISIYIPMVKTGGQKEQNPVMFKNMLKEAQEKLSRRGLKKEEQEAILNPAFSYHFDKAVWAHPDHGLAVFIARNTFMPFRLPVPFAPEVMIANRFYVKPLLPLLVNDGMYFLLTLNLDRTRLFRGSRFALSEIEFNAPPGIDEALAFDDTEVLRQSASRTAQVRGDRNAMFFGHGLETEENKGRIFRYFRKVNDAVHEVVHGKNEPLVTAGNDYLIPIYRDANTYPHLVETAIRKNPLSMQQEELHRESWEIVRPGFESVQRTEYERYRRLRDTALTSDDLSEIVQSAVNDRIETLFLSRDSRVWGTYNTDTFSVALHGAPEDGDRELLDFAAVETLLHNGNVFVTDAGDVPGDKAAGAIFRF